eukprot:Amastigsp_a843042_51.p4 type:complete len:189 gc:universal Amastigsp_a843042_51:623-57(-)
MITLEPTTVAVSPFSAAALAAMAAARRSARFLNLMPLGTHCAQSLSFLLAAALWADDTRPPTSAASCHCSSASGAGATIALSGTTPSSSPRLAFSLSALHAASSAARCLSNLDWSARRSASSGSTNAALASALAAATALALARRLRARSRSSSSSCSRRRLRDASSILSASAMASAARRHVSLLSMTS